VAELKFQRFLGRRQETTPYMLPIGSVAALNQDAERSRAVTPGMGLILGAATILAAPFVILDSLVGVDWTDDQGTLMAGFRSLLDGHRMYDEIYSLYWPLYNLVYGLIYGVLRVPLTHDAGRLMFAALPRFGWPIPRELASFVWKLARSGAIGAAELCARTSPVAPVVAVAGPPCAILPVRFLSTDGFAATGVQQVSRLRDHARSCLSAMSWRPVSSCWPLGGRPVEGQRDARAGWI
jgi:hypothetical protein